MIKIFKTFYTQLKSKAFFISLYTIIHKIFHRSNLNKIIIIFTFGLISRIFISNFYSINVFTEYFHYISIAYYSLFSLFIVIVHEVVNYFNINFIPHFITDFSSHIVNLYNNNMNILKLIIKNLKSPLYTLIYL